MRLDKKIIFSVACAMFVASVSGFVLLVFEPLVRPVILAVTISSAICALVFFIASMILRDKPVKIKALVTTLIAIVSLITVFATVIVSIAPLFIFPMNHDEEAYDALMSLSEESGSRVSAVNAGGYNGWRISAKDIAKDEKRPVVICFVGNGMNSSATTLRVFKNKDELYSGFAATTDFVCVDYPGYGINDGTPTGDSLREMALAVYDEVASWPTTSEVISFGYSIGTGPATYLASERNVSGLILWAPYANGYDMYNNVINVFYGPFKLMVRFKMDSEKYIKNVECPVLILASDEDEIIPYRSSRELFTNAGPSASNFVTVSGIGHNDFWEDQKVLDNTFGLIEEAC